VKPRLVDLNWLSHLNGSISMAEGDLDGGLSNSEKRDASVNISQTAGASVLSKWLERSPPKSYPRPW